MTGQDADIVRASLQIALYNKTWIIKPKNLNCDGKQEINIQLVGSMSLDDTEHVFRLNGACP